VKEEVEARSGEGRKGEGEWGRKHGGGRRGLGVPGRGGEGVGGGKGRETVGVGSMKCGTCTSSDRLAGRIDR